MMMFLREIGNKTNPESPLLSRLQVCISFIKDTIVDDETPCWVEVWFVEHVENVRSKFAVFFHSLTMAELNL